LIAVWVDFSVRFAAYDPFWCMIAVAKKTEALQKALELSGMLQMQS
jgi:hypothetical protein